jgi:hypothetical protein
MVVLDWFVARRAVRGVVWVNSTVLAVPKWEEMVDPFRDKEVVFEVKRDQSGTEKFPIN